MWLSSPPGHIYLSSPFLFEHCISYRPEEPTLALMCRFGFMDEEDSLWVNHLRGRDMSEANLLGIAAEGRMERFVFFWCPKSLWSLFFSHRIGIPSFLWWRHWFHRNQFESWRNISSVSSAIVLGRVMTGDGRLEFSTWGWRIFSWFLQFGQHFLDHIP